MAPSDAAATLIARGLVLMLLALPVSFVGAGALKLLAMQRAKHDPWVPGVVVAAEVERVSSMRGNGERESFTYLPVIRYRFRAGATEHLGERYSLMGESASEPWAREVVQAHPPGSAVTVFLHRGRTGEPYLTTGGGYLVPAVLVLIGSVPLAALAVARFRAASRG